MIAIVTAPVVDLPPSRSLQVRQEGPAVQVVPGAGLPGVLCPGGRRLPGLPAGPCLFRRGGSDATAGQETRPAARPSQRRQSYHHQGRTEVSRGHQGRTEVSRGHLGWTEVLRGHQGRTEVSRGHQGWTEVSRGHRGWTEVSRGHQGGTEVIRGHQGRTGSVDVTRDGRGQ